MPVAAGDLDGGGDRAGGRLVRRPWPALVNLALLPLLLHPHAVEGRAARAWARRASSRTGSASPCSCSSTRAARRAGPPAARAARRCRSTSRFIMLSAGVYKFTAGYPRNDGMELGMVQPDVGLLVAAVRARSARPPGVLDPATRWRGAPRWWPALLMLVPPTRELGGLLLVAELRLHPRRRSGSGSSARW